MTDLNLPNIILDPRNEEEVILRAYDRILTASNGVINDFSPSSPIAALVEGQAFVQMELLWYLNQLPTALALEVFRLLGVTRSSGTTAKGQVTFVLTNTLSSDFVVSAGYFIPFRDAGFVTTQTLLIPSGGIEGTVTVEAVKEGAEYNVGAFGLNAQGLSLTYLQAIYNANPINGGSDLESIANTVDRAQVAVRSRNTLVSVEDYEQVSSFLLGTGSHATAYPLLSANKTTEVLGHIHVFLLDIDGQPPSISTCQDIQQELRSRSFVGAAVWVSPADIELFDIEVVVKVNYLEEETVDDINDALLYETSPEVMSLGTTLKVKELEYIARQQSNVTEILSLTINGQALNKPMPNKYTLGKLNNLTVVQQDATGATATFFRSNDISV